MILGAPPITDEQATAIMTTILRAWRTKRPDLQLGQFLLLACSLRSPASPAGLLMTIETWALAELVQQVPAEKVGPVAG